MVVPKICSHGRTEHARGIHGRAGKRSSKQNVERDCRSNDEAGDAPWPAFVDGGAVNHEYEKESEDPFDQNSLPRGQINGELWSASDYDIASEQTATNQCSADAAETLRDPIAQRVRPFRLTSVRRFRG